MVSRSASVRALPNRYKNRAASYHVIYIPPEPQPQVDLPSPRWWEAGNYLTGALFLLVTKIGTLSLSPLIWCTVIAVIIRSCAYGFYPKSELPISKVTKTWDMIGWASTVLAVAVLIGQIILNSIN